MASWSEIEKAAPALAERARAALDPAAGARRHKTIATLRADGSPRISGIECWFADGELVFGSMPGSLKSADLRRDPRFALHGPTIDPPGETPAGWEGFTRHGVLPDLEALHLIARAITPPKRVRRFDTRFFAVDSRMVAAEEPGRVQADAEFTELAWVRLDAARALDLPYITRAILDDLEAQIAVDFAPHRMIPFHYERYGRRERVAL